jgi:hypothetical protein
MDLANSSFAIASWTVRREMWGRAIIPAITFSFLSNGIAHMILNHPKPYGALTLNNSPLDATGVDFPCKLRKGVYDYTEINYWKAGELQSVSFIGTAVHGGGSCQFSVTEDEQPTESSKFKVIHSVTGGCPASAEGNLEAGQQAKVFDFLVPEGLPSGMYTFAWTWFNRHGAREMYMNCAPISVSGAKENATFLEGLPDMFVANLPGTSCSTVERFDFVFPQPGDSVSTGTPVTIAALQGTGCASAGLGSGSGAIHTPERAAERTGGHSANRNFPEESPVSFTAATNNPTLIKVAKMSDSTTSAPAAVSSVATKLDIESVIGTRSITTTPQVETGAPTTCIPCSDEGSIACIDETHFGVCNYGCATRQLLAEGTSCWQGSIVKRKQL